MDINVVPRDSQIDGEVANNTARNVTIVADVTDAETGKAVPNGPVVAKLNGTIIGEGSVTDGKAVIPTSLDKTGNYEVELEYLGNENYTTSNTTIPVNVAGRVSNITEEPNNTTLGNTTVNVKLVDPETGEAIPNAPIDIIVNGTVVGQGITDENGTVEIPVDLPVGEHDITAVYPGDDTYNGINTTVPMIVEPRNSQINGKVANNTARNVTIIADVIDAETGKVVPNGPVIAKYNGTIIGTGEIVNGKAIIPTNLDKIGNYEVELEYLGNENYTTSNTTIPVNVVGRESKITGVPGNTTLGNSTVNITLVDPESNEAIPNAPVTITLPDGRLVNATTDENGRVEVPVDLPVGSHTLDVTFPGNETYKPATASVDINILPRESDITAELLNDTAGNVTVKVTVVDAETGELIADGPVEVYVNGTLVGTGEVVDGVAIIRTDITEQGNHTLDVKYLGNDNYTASNDTVDADVIVHPTVIEPEVVDPVIGETEITIKLVDPETGDKLINKAITVVLPDGTTIDATTDENGNVVLAVDLPAGPNEIRIIFAGDDEYKASTTPFVVNVEKRNATLRPIVKSTINGKAQVDIEARDANTGELITSGEIELTLPDGSKVSALLNSEGIATFHDVNVPIGSTDYNATLLENPIYNKADTNLTLSNTHPTKPEPTVVDPVIGETEIVIKLVDPETGDKLINKAIKVVLPDGRIINTTTDDEGIVDLPVDLPAGPNEITIIFEGDDEYNPSTTPFEVNVEKRNATLEPSIVDYVNATAVVEVVARDAKTGELITSGEIELTLPDGTKVTAPLNSEGIATFNGINVPIGSNDYNVSLVENSVYNKAESNISVDNKPRIVIGEWKLVCFNETPDITPNNTHGIDKEVKPVNVIKNNVPVNKAQFNRNMRTYNKYHNRNARYSKRNSYNRYNKRPSWKQPVNIVPVEVLSKAKYKLFITLYAQYFDGEMSFEDFIAILKINGIEVASVSNWNSDGQIVLEYDNLEDVPDSIEIHDNSGHVQDYSNSINKDNAPDNDGVVDSGNIEVQQTSSAHSASSSNSANSVHDGSSSNSASVAAE